MSTPFSTPSFQRSTLVTALWRPAPERLGWSTHLQYRLLKCLAPPARNASRETPELLRRSIYFGREFLQHLRGRTVLDYGCGEGADAVELAKLGARQVIGLDIRPDVLNAARRRAAAQGVRHVCRFATSWPEPVDAIVSVDAFEHFDDPAGVLEDMARLLKPTGSAIVSFGPPWYHPLGGHLFSMFPWAHLLFTEKALIRWRSDIRSDGATRFEEVEGGLNRMTIRRFVRLVNRSPLRFERFETVPIRKLKPLHNVLTREFTTAVVRCRLVRRESGQR